MTRYLPLFFLRLLMMMIPISAAAFQTFKSSSSWWCKTTIRRHAHKIAVVGGALAGLSTTHHLLEHASKNDNNKNTDIQITLFDRAPVGTGGASAVAGGLVHPLSPRGKLAYRGLEGLAATNRLVDAAVQQQRQIDSSADDVVLRKEIYRVALSEQNADQFQKTAAAYPEFCEWVGRSEMDPSLHLGKDSLGYLKLSNGCKVIHIPSYLALLWRACEKSNKADWKLVDSDNDLKKMLGEYDTVVLAAGSGLFDSLIPAKSLPIQLVRGQSAIIKTHGPLSRIEAILCGKYVSPLPQKDMLLIGATHEYKQAAWAKDDVLNDLRDRTEAVAPYAWNGSVLKITEGFRVQSDRGRFGRLPIIGKFDGEFGANTWLFAGLSSRGLLYHGLFGEVLARAILANDEDIIRQETGDLLWWKK